MPYRTEGFSARDRNRSRARLSRRQDAAGDAIVIALTAQVLACLILLAAAYMIKKADEEKYTQVKEQYDIMVGDPAQNSQAAEMFGSSGGVTGLFASLEQFFSNLLESIFADGEQPLVVGEYPPAGEDEAEAEAEDTFYYNYLEPTGTLRAAGGMMPVKAAATDGQLYAPEGTTLSPVTIAGVVRPPISGVVTSPYGYRYHPITESTDFHTGLDVAAEEGRAILSAMPGKVSEVGESDIYGLYVVVEHGNNVKTSYSHCSEIIAREGMVVRQGERIAKVGQTGTATGPHLHFSLLVDDTYTDPYWVLRDNLQLVE